jgi:hypothetical protein
MDKKQLKDKCKKLEKICNQRSYPTDMYEQEIQWILCKLNNKLDTFTIYHQEILNIITPQSYQEIYHTSLPIFKENVIKYLKLINEYIHYCNKVKEHEFDSPIWRTIIKKKHEEILSYNVKIQDKYNNWKELLHTDAWSISLDNITRLIRTNTLDYINQIDNTFNCINKKIVKDIKDTIN